MSGETKGVALSRKSFALNCKSMSLFAERSLICIKRKFSSNSLLVLMTAVCCRILSFRSPICLSKKKRERNAIITTSSVKTTTYLPIVIENRTNLPINEAVKGSWGKRLINRRAGTASFSIYKSGLETKLPVSSKFRELFSL